MFETLISAASRSPAARWACGLLIGVALIGLDGVQRSGAMPAASAVWRSADPATSGKALVLQGSGAIPMPDHTPAAHASTLLALPATHPAAVMAFWFAGQRESADDVQIAASQFDRSSQQWSAARFVVNRKVVGAQLGYGIRRLGNPVAWLDAQGKVHLFVVATGLGGWAAARIVHLRQSDAGQDFSQLKFDPVRVLPLSWLWNTSFLVRTAPLALADGGMVLPVHFELGIKYPVALRFDARGEFKGMVRISSRKHLLQPTLLMVTASEWLALMRDQSPMGKVAVAQTTDAGQHWRDLPELTLDNPDSSVAGLAVVPGRLWLAHNSSLHNRNVLDLSESTDGKNWSLVQTLARGQGAAEYSYPAITWADNSVWLSYTDQRQRISWQRFSFSAPNSIPAQAR